MKKGILFAVVFTCFGAGISCGKNNVSQPFSKKGDKSQSTSTRNNVPPSPEENCLYIAESRNNKIRKVDPRGIISPVAGNGRAGDGKDGILGVYGELRDPQGVAIDSSGNLYIADTGNHKIRKVSPQGIMTTYAGTGTLGDCGDGGPGTDAELSLPRGVAVDATGNLYIVDSGNHKVRKVDPQGIITTVAGNGHCGSCPGGTRATEGELGFPYDVAVDTTGNLYITSSRHSAIMKVDLNGIISSIAGELWSDDMKVTYGRHNRPHGITVDSIGNIYISDTKKHTISKINSKGIITPYAGKGTRGMSGDGRRAIDAALEFPYGLAVDSFGNLYIADSDNNRVRKVDPKGIISTVAGKGVRGYNGDGGPAIDAKLWDPMGVAVGRCIKLPNE